MVKESNPNTRCHTKQQLKRRMMNIKKKSMELSTLCGVDVCIVSIGEDGKLETWPENPNQLKTILTRYKKERTKIKKKMEMTTAQSQSHVTTLNPINDSDVLYHDQSFLQLNDQMLDFNSKYVDNSSLLVKQGSTITQCESAAFMPFLANTQHVSGYQVQEDCPTTTISKEEIIKNSILNMSTINDSDVFYNDPSFLQSNDQILDFIPKYVDNSGLDGTQGSTISEYESATLMPFRDYTEEVPGHKGHADCPSTSISNEEINSMLLEMPYTAGEEITLNFNSMVESLDWQFSPSNHVQLPVFGMSPQFSPLNYDNVQLPVLGSPHQFSPSNYNNVLLEDGQFSPSNLPVFGFPPQFSPSNYDNVQLPVLEDGQFSPSNNVQLPIFSLPLQFSASNYDNVGLPTVGSPQQFLPFNYDNVQLPVLGSPHQFSPSNYNQVLPVLEDGQFSPSNLPVFELSPQFSLSNCDNVQLSVLEDGQFSPSNNVQLQILEDRQFSTSNNDQLPIFGFPPQFSAFNYDNVQLPTLGLSQQLLPSNYDNVQLPVLESLHQFSPSNLPVFELPPQ